MIDIIPNWHPILVHFTIGLLATCVIFYTLAILLPLGERLSAQWFVVARWCLWTGMGITILTLLAGYQAYNTVAHDTPSHAAMTEHRNWAFATASAFTVLLIWSIHDHFKKIIPGKLFLIIAIACGGLLASTGWHGGEAVYRYGIGVMSLPQSSGEGHAHEHAAGNEHGTKQPMNAETMPSQSENKRTGDHHENDQPHAH